MAPEKKDFSGRYGSVVRKTKSKIDVTFFLNKKSEAHQVILANGFDGS